MVSAVVVFRLNDWLRALMVTTSGYDHRYRLRSPIYTPIYPLIVEYKQNIQGHIYKEQQNVELLKWMSSPFCASVLLITKEDPQI